MAKYVHLQFSRRGAPTCGVHFVAEGTYIDTRPGAPHTLTLHVVPDTLNLPKLLIMLGQTTEAAAHIVQVAADRATGLPTTQSDPITLFVTTEDYSISITGEDRRNPTTKITLQIISEGAPDA